MSDKLASRVPAGPALAFQVPHSGKVATSLRPLPGYLRGEVARYWADERYRPRIEEYLSAKDKNIMELTLQDWEVLSKILMEESMARIWKLREQIGIEDRKEDHDALERTWQETRRF